MVGDHRPRACASFFGGWQEQPVIHDGVTKTRFTSIISWESQVARKEWYGKFADRLQFYAHFGHVTDALKILATGDIESRMVILENEDAELMRWRNPHPNLELFSSSK